MAGRKRDDLENIEVKMRSRREAEEKQFAEAKPDPSAVTPEFLVTCADDGERGAAEIFRRLYMTWNGSTSPDAYKQKRLFCPDPDLGWHWWDGHHWNPDRSYRVLESIDGVVDVLRAESTRQWSVFRQVKKEGDEEGTAIAEDRAKSLWKMAKQLNSSRTRKSLLTLAAAGRDAPPWDRSPWLLPVANGAVDLKTGRLMPGHPSEYLRGGAPVAYRENATCPQWEHFLSQIMGGDGEMVAFLKRILGYAITGLTIHHKFFVFWGRSRNGKGTLIETIKKVLGPLAGPIMAEMLLDQGRSRSSGSASPDIVDLMGKRIIWASETDENRRFSSSAVKLMTGGDTLKGRPLQGMMIEIQPNHTLFLLTNERPSAPASDQGFWSRCLLIKFLERFVENPHLPNEHPIDVHLPAKLEAELEGILRWLVEGCLEWQRDGLKPPPRVLADTDEYRGDVDILGRFLSEECVRIVGSKIQCAELYEHYEKWAKANGLKPWSSIKFSKELTSRGLQKAKISNHYWLDVEIKTEFNADRCVGWENL
jgi:putative DNA primase/helicase